jgi:hypothetical protein
MGMLDRRHEEHWRAVWQRRAEERRFLRRMTQHEREAIEADELSASASVIPIGPASPRRTAASHRPVVLGDID